MYCVRLFGKFEVTGEDGRPVTVAGAKTQGLIAFLAMSVEMPPTRDRIINLFWGDRFTDQARQSLRQAVAKLRRILPADGKDALLVEQDRIGLNPDVVRVDADDFAHLAEADDPESVLKAVELLRGPLLEGFYGQQAEFEDWISSERQRINELSAKVLERASNIALKQGGVDKALEHARRAAELNQWSDAAQMILLRLYAQNGDRAAAIQHFQAYEKSLKDELGIAAGQELLNLVEQIRSEGFIQSPDKADALPAHPAASGAEEQGRSSIAIVPFAWMASEADHSFLVDGLVEDMSIKLARFSWLDVKAAASTHGTRLTGSAMSELYAE